MKSYHLIFTILFFVSLKMYSQDPLIGKWKFHQSYINGVPEDYSGNEVIEFFSDGAFVKTFTESNNKKYIVKGKWKKDKSEYIFIYGTISQQVFEHNEIHFKNDTHYYAGTFDNKTYKIIYQRIK